MTMPYVLQVRLIAVLALLAALLSPLGAAAVEPADRVVRIGFLSQSPDLPDSNSGRIRRHLAKFGYVEGRNLVIEARDGHGDPALLKRAAAELVALKVDLIFAITSPAAFAAKAATDRIPIVVWAAHGAVETQASNARATALCRQFSRGSARCWTPGSS